MDTIRGKFFKQHLLSDQFLDLIEKNKRPMDELMSYYQCAIMEIETKFRVLNQEYSLSYDQNPIEGIKTRVKSYESIMRKIRVKDIPVTLESIEENIRDIAGVRVICSFPSDIYKLADSFLKQYQVKAGDVIEVRESSRSSAKFAKLTGPEAPVVALPAWLNRETGSLKGVVAKLPERSDIDYEVAEHLIVELYSK